MEDGLDAAKLLADFSNTIHCQLRSLGVVLYDDAGNRMAPGGSEEHRVITNIARNIAQIVVSQNECQTPVAGSGS